MAWPRVRGMRAFEFATPGLLRQKLSELALSGVKTSTTGLLEANYQLEGEALEHVGERLALVDDASEYVATMEITGVRVCRLDDVTLEHAMAEGEGCETVEDWRHDHIKYWSDQGYEVDSDTRVVCLSFRVDSVTE